MSTFKTRAEISGSSEFVQYLEQLKSGSLASGEGVNRALERLAENNNALMDAVQGAKSHWLVGGGTLALSSLTLSWSSALRIYFPGELGGVSYNEVASGSQALGASSVLYVVLDRESEGAAVTLQVASSWADYLAVVSGEEDRLDYLPIGFHHAGAGLFLLNGQVLRDGYALEGMARDTQYGQQAEVTQVRSQQKDNLNLALVGGGDISWDAGTGILTFSAHLDIEFPQSSGRNRVSAASFTIPAGSVLYVTLSRNPSGVAVLTPVVAAYGSVPDTDSALVLASHRSIDSRVYLWDGTALSDGETARLGGVRTGVQFFWKSGGLGVNSQVYDLTSLVSANTEYRVGSGELMVYRNGRKASASRAYWQGVYPAGSLNTSLGGLDPLDDYVEEDTDGVGGVLTGNRILWLREDPTPRGGSLTANETSTSLYFAAGTFPANLEQTFPQSDDTVEIFVGNQGAAPFVTIPDGIYGFEIVWTHSSSTVRTRGGTLVTGGIKYKNLDTQPLQVVLDGTSTPPAIFAGDSLPEDDWAYIYLGPGSAPGGQPDIRVSSLSPREAEGLGCHPSHTNYKFLTSCFVKTGRASFVPFVKRDSWVDIDGSSFLGIEDAFSSAVTGAFEAVDISDYLPPTAQGAAHLRILVKASGSVSAGDEVSVDVKSTSSSWGSIGAGSMRGIRSTSGVTVPFTFKVLSRDFDVRMSTTDIASVDSAVLLGYAEGRFTTASGW